MLHLTDYFFLVLKFIFKKFQNQTCIPENIAIALGIPFQPSYVAFMSCYVLQFLF